MANDREGVNKPLVFIAFITTCASILMAVAVVVMAAAIAARSPSPPDNANESPAPAVDLSALSARVLALESGAVENGTRVQALELQLTEAKTQLQQLIDAEEMRSFLFMFGWVVDSQDLTLLAGMADRLADDIVIQAIDFDGLSLTFNGKLDIFSRFGPIIQDAKATLAPSGIQITFTSETTADGHFKFINSVKPPPQLGTNIDSKIALLADITCSFRRNSAGVWQLTFLRLFHELFYPGSIPLITAIANVTAPFL